MLGSSCELKLLTRGLDGFGAWPAASEAFSCLRGPCLNKFVSLDPARSQGISVVGEQGFVPEDVSILNICAASTVIHFLNAHK